MRLIKIGVFALLVAFLGSCTQDDSEQNSLSNSIRFHADNISTRVQGALWDKEDLIGVYAFPSGEKLTSQNALDELKNRSFVTHTGDGLFVAKEQPNPSYPEDGSKIDFIAYYPFFYDQKVQETTLEVNIEDQKKQEDLDLLYSSNAKEISNQSTSVKLDFRRLMSKVKLTLLTSNSSTSLAVSDVQALLKSISTQGYLDLSTGVLRVEGASKKSVTPLVKEENGSIVIEFTLFPGKVTGSELELTIKDKKYNWVIANDIEELVEGQRYTLNLQIDYEGGEVEEPKGYIEWPKERKDLTNTMLVTHMIDTRYLNPSYPDQRKEVRNYSLLYDIDHGVAHWVAYPMHGAYVKGGNRTNAWGYDPVIPQSLQVEMDRVKWGTRNRGHQIASADRSASREINKTTFYYTNMTPQDSQMNAGIWARLEDKVRSWISGCDTLYVVTGMTLPQPPEAIDYTHGSNGKAISIPNYYFKALAKRKGDTYETIGFKIANKTSVSSHNFMQYKMTVGQLEKETGFTFFPQLPNPSIKNELHIEHWN